MELGLEKQKGILALKEELKQKLRDEIDSKYFSLENFDKIMEELEKLRKRIY